MVIIVCITQFFRCEWVNCVIAASDGVVQVAWCWAVYWDKMRCCINVTRTTMLWDRLREAVITGSLCSKVRVSVNLLSILFFVTVRYLPRDHLKRQRDWLK